MGGNWGRWGDDDERGAVNLVDDAKRLQAVGSVRSGLNVSLSMPLDPEEGPLNPEPVGYTVRTMPWEADGAGYADDELTISCHQRNVTHLDALCHVWEDGRTWGGRVPEDVMTPQSSLWAGVDAWSDGIVTRGVLLDIPALRGTSHVTLDRPVQGCELQEAASRAGVEIEPGDAVCIYGGREAWDESASASWESYPPRERPGLHGSCVEVLGDLDVALVLWDLVDARPAESGEPWPVHRLLITHGVPLVDHARLGPLAGLCRERDQHTFMLVVAPLVIPGGTGSPVNPVAIL